MRERYEDAPFDVKLGDELVIVVVDLAALAGVESLERGNRGQCSRQHGVGPNCGGASADETDEQDDETSRQNEATPLTARFSRSFPASPPRHTLLLYRREKRRSFG